MSKIKLNINIDRLEITYRASERVRDALSAIERKKSFGDITLIRMDNPKHYAHEFSLYGSDFDGVGECKRYIGILFFGSINKNRQHIYIRYANAAVYDESLLASRFYIESALGLEFYRVSKLDIAIDTNINLVKRFNRLWRNEEYSFVILKKRYDKIDVTVKELLHIANGTRKWPLKNRSIFIENKDKSLMARCYNKTKELTQSSKDYIPNISGKMPMYRIEVALSNHKNIAKSLKSMHVEEETELYSRLQDRGFLFDLFMTTLNRIVRVRKGRKGYNLLELILQ